MTHLVVLNLGKGNCSAGFASVTAQLWHSRETAPIQAIAALPPASALEAAYQHWQRFYVTLYSGMNWRRSRSAADFEIDDDDITVVTRAGFASLCQNLQEEFNQWLNCESFRKIDQTLRTQLNPKDEIRLVVTADADTALRLPWHLWQFLEDYPLAELALSPANYVRSLQTKPASPQRKVHILAILGNSHGIDTEVDRQFLERLPQSNITFLVEPNRVVLSEQLWQGQWDILFFAGHSSSQGRGEIQINATDVLTIEQLKYGLRTAIANGLKLAIFNSCDGLGLAQDLADLNLPQIIVMRESVPDRVAQEFLKSFLVAFSGGRSLYASVRQARERLQIWEDHFPCATWLPVVCQNPAEVPPHWKDWSSKPQSLPRPSRQDLKAILLSSLVATGLIVGVRWLGFLQPLELAAFDRLMQLRPAELPDPRLLIIGITESDIRAEGQALRQGSLSDHTLNLLLKAIQQAQPRVIGLDLYRDRTASPELVSSLQSDRLVAICKRPDPPNDPTGILPPPEVEASRLGFSDFVEDTDGTVRRQLLFTSPNSVSACATPYSLSVQLAFRYFNALNLTPQFTPQGELQIDRVTFHAIRSRTGGYQPVDARGSQILLNYRAAPTLSTVAQQVTVTQVLQGQINAAAIKDRIVLIGVDAPSSGDRWVTPYGRSFQLQLSGVVLHAQMTSQLLSAVLDRRPLLWVWHPWIELGWSGAWAMLGGLLIWAITRPIYRIGAIACFTLAGVSFCFVLLLQGGWIPLVPAIGSFSISILIYHFRSIRAHRSP